MIGGVGSTSNRDASIDNKTQTVLLFAEIERLQHVNAELYNELLRFKSNQDKGSLYEERLKILENENRNLSELVNSYTKEHDNLKAREGRLSEMETRIGLLATEN